MLADYRAQLANARDEGNRIIEEARQTAEQLRRDLQARAEEESQTIVSRAQEEIRAERDRVFQDLRRQVGEIAVELAARVVGQSLDKASHEPLTDEQRTRLTEALSKATGKSLEVKVVLDPSVIGGIVAHVGDEVFDGSIRSRLGQARQLLGSA